MNDSLLAGMIDHTLLAADASAAAVARICAQAVEFGFHSVCVNPARVGLAVRLLTGGGGVGGGTTSSNTSRVCVCSVVNFPLGAGGIAAAVAQARTALDEGAGEIDLVQNIGALKEGDDDTVHAEIAAVAQAVHHHQPAAPHRQRLLKVILETALLNEAEIVCACTLAVAAGADYVKTSTGFAKPTVAGRASGATLAHVRLMRETVGAGIGVKASGGISDRATAEAMVAAGASRLGTSRSVEIITNASHKHYKQN